jgi:hypothetical protein
MLAETREVPELPARTALTRHAFGGTPQRVDLSLDKERF